LRFCFLLEKIRFLPVRLWVRLGVDFSPEGLLDGVLLGLSVTGVRHRESRGLTILRKRLAGRKEDLSRPNN